MTRVVTFLSHTAQPGGGELSLSRYLRATRLPVRLVTMATGAVWEDLPCPVSVAPDLVRVAAALREDDGPVVANSMRSALYAALTSPRRRPLLYWVRDGLTDSAMSQTGLRLTRHVTARRVTAYLANSGWTAATVRDALGARAERVQVVQSLCGVPEAPEEGSPRAAPRDPLRLLYLGRLAPWKGAHVAVRAVPLLRAQGLQVTLSIAGAAHFGEDDYVGQLAELARSTEGVTMLGHVDDVATLLASHDLTVHCSLRPEPFGQVVVQSLPAAVPVVATQGGGPSEILRDAPVDLLHEPGDAAALAAAVQRVLADYPGASRWALRRAADFSDATAAARTDTVLGDHLSRSPSGPRPAARRSTT